MNNISKQQMEMEMIIIKTIERVKKQIEEMENGKNKNKFKKQIEKIEEKKMKEIEKLKKEMEIAEMEFQKTINNIIFEDSETKEMEKPIEEEMENLTEENDDDDYESDDYNEDGCLLCDNCGCEDDDCVCDDDDDNEYYEKKMEKELNELDEMEKIMDELQFKDNKKKNILKLLVNPSYNDFIEEKKNFVKSEFDSIFEKCKNYDVVKCLCGCEFSYTLKNRKLHENSDDHKKKFNMLFLINIDISYDI
jgi:chromosome segregation ATPase